MINISLTIICILSLILGSILLFFPESLVTISTNEYGSSIGFIRILGSSILATQFFGLLHILYKRYNKLVLLRIISLTSVSQSITLIYVRISGEILTTNYQGVNLVIYLHAFISIYLVWLCFNKSHKFR